MKRTQTEQWILSDAEMDKIIEMQRTMLRKYSEILTKPEIDDIVKLVTIHLTLLERTDK